MSRLRNKWIQNLPDSWFLFLLDFRWLDGREQAIEFRGGGIADGAHGQDGLACGKRDFDLRVGGQAQHGRSQRRIVGQAFDPRVGIARGLAMGGHEKRETMLSLRRHILLFDGDHVPELHRGGRLGEPGGGIDLDEGVAGDEAIERGHLAVHGADRVLGRLEAEVLAQVALAVGLDLVLDQFDALDLERLEFLRQHAVVTRPHIDRGGRRSSGAEDPFSGEGHATLSQQGFEES